MNLQDIDNAIERMCFQLEKLPVYVTLDAACKSGTVAANLGNALAALLTARKLYESRSKNESEVLENTEKSRNEKPIDWAGHLTGL